MNEDDPPMHQDSDDAPPDWSRSREIERNRRIAERAEASQARSDRRAAEREAAARLREEARDKRRIEDEARRTALAAEREERPKRRASGALSRTGEQKIVRNTRNYVTQVDTGRIRELARRGASIDGLAKVFGIAIEQVEAALRDA